MTRDGIAGTRHGRGPGSYAALAFGGVRLAVSQSDIRTIEAAEDIFRLDPPKGGVGWISALEGLRPVYALSPDLVLLSVVPPSRQLCVVLGREVGMFALLCDELQVLDTAESAFMPLPEGMRSPGCPVAAVAAHEQGILCLSSAQALASLTGAATTAAPARAAAPEV